MKHWYILLIIPLISACSYLDLYSEISGQASTYVPPKESGSISVYFCPKDNCSDYMLNTLETAEKSIHCALFDLKLPEIIDVLEKKSKKIDVKVVVDGNNKKELNHKIYRYDTTSQYSHNKFCIIDDKILTTGSFNPTERGSYKNNNNFLIIESRYLSQNHEDEFNELWNGNFGDGNQVNYPIIYLNNIKIQNYFCPDDDCDDIIINELKKAEKTINFMIFSFTHEEVADAMLFSDAEVKGVFEKVQAGSKYSQYQRLKDFGLDVKKDNNSANMHHKVFIIDEKTVITGSTNPSKSGFYKNDENVLIIKDKEIAMKYLEEFNYVYNQ